MRTGRPKGKSFPYLRTGSVDSFQDLQLLDLVRFFLRRGRLFARWIHQRESQIHILLPKHLDQVHILKRDAFIGIDIIGSELTLLVIGVA